MLVTRQNFTSCSSESRKLFNALQNLINHCGRLHQQYGQLVSMADEACWYSYKQEHSEKVQLIDKKFIEGLAFRFTDLAQPLAFKPINPYWQQKGEAKNEVL